MSANLLIRRVFPSISRLTYNPVFRAILRAFDVMPKAVYREFRDLPPNDLRCRVGVGNRLFANHVLHIKQGYNFWLYAFSRGWCDFASDIVEIGVGCGRRAFHVRDFRLEAERFIGSYLAIDIDRELLEWCATHFDDRFEFVQSTHASRSYVNTAAAEGSFRIPRADSSIDFVFGTSVFSHLLEPEVHNYLEEGVRVLRPGRVMAMSCFCFDLAVQSVGVRHSFSKRIGNAHVQSLRQPEAAVAYESEFLKELAVSSGFSSAEVMYHANEVQQLLVCTK
jgi:SAM-dependent methyltransferase